MANKLNLNVLISSPLRVISLYFIFVFPSRSVRQLHATGRPRIPQLPAEHSGWHPAGGEEAGKAERTPQEQRHHRHHGGRDGEQDWANMGSRYLPRHPDQWDPLPQLWNSMCGSAPHQYILCPCVTLNKSSLLNKSEKGISLLQRCWEMLKRFSVRTRWAPATHFTSGLQMVLSSQVWGRGVGRVALNNPCKHRTDTKATQFNKHFKDWLSVCVCCPVTAQRAYGHWLSRSRWQLSYLMSLLSLTGEQQRWGFSGSFCGRGAEHINNTLSQVGLIYYTFSRS